MDNKYYITHPNTRTHTGIVVDSVGVKSSKLTTVDFILINRIFVADVVKSLNVAHKSNT